MIQEEVVFKSAGGMLRGIVQIPKVVPAPGIILFHGLTNDKTDCPLITETSNALVNSGFVCFKFDFFGSGDSPGNMSDKTIDILLQNAKDSVEYLSKDKRVTSIGLWGRSFGGTLVCLLPFSKKIKARVSVSGVSLFEKEFEEGFKKLQKKELQLEKEGKKLPGTGRYKGSFEFKQDWYESLNGLGKKVSENLSRLSKFLVLATTPDQKVPLVHASNIINNVKDPKKLFIFEGVDHGYVGAEKQAVRLTIDWYKKYLL